jgi:hypothetical protein
MALKKDKAKVLDEVWTEERIRSFLDVQPAVGVDADFHSLLKAYQQMRADDFKLFIDFFVADQRDVNARNGQGQTLANVIASHHRSAPFIDILRTASAAR